MCLEDFFQRRLKNICEDKKYYTEDVFKTSSICLHQDKCLLGVKLNDATKLLETREDGIWEKERLC